MKGSSACLVSASCLCFVNGVGISDGNGLNMRPNWQYLGWKSTAKNRRRIGPILKTVAESIGRPVDAVGAFDVGVLAHGGAFSIWLMQVICLDSSVNSSMCLCK